jgi:hypothetical protein
MGGTYAGTARSVKSASGINDFLFRRLGAVEEGHPDAGVNEDEGHPDVIGITA